MASYSNPEPMQLIVSLPVAAVDWYRQRVQELHERALTKMFGGGMLPHEAARWFRAASETAWDQVWAARVTRRGRG